MSQTFGSANIGGDNYAGKWSGLPYQDPIGANSLPNQGAGPYGQNSLNGHIGANWLQGPVLPPSRAAQIAADHGPAADNYNDEIYWQSASGSWSIQVNPGTPMVGAGVKVAGSPNQMVVLANPDFAVRWNVGDEMTFVSSNGLPATRTALNAMTGTILAFSSDFSRVTLDMGASVAALDLTGWSAVVTVTTP